MIEDRYIRVLVVDDHPAIRAGIKALIGSQPDMQCCGEAADGNEAIEAYRKLLPDIVLMDLRMPGLGGAEVILSIVSEFPKARIVVNTTFDTDEDIFRAVQCGARSYLTKDMSKEEIFKTIRNVFEGKASLPKQIQERLTAHSQRPQLTRREMEVLELLAKGRSNKEIASILHLSEDAVKSRLKILFQKMDVEDRTGAVVTALRLGLVQLDAGGGE